MSKLPARILCSMVTVGGLLAFAIATERPAHAYVDPGSGLLLIQTASSIVAGVLFYFRRRLGLLFARKDLPKSDVSKERK